MKIRNYICPSVFVLAAALFTSCSPDEAGNGNGLTNTQELDASFTVTPVGGSSNRVLLTAATGGLTHSWNNVRGVDSKEMFYPLAGNYDVTHTVCGKGGTDCVSTTQTINVPADDPIAFNRIEGGGFDSAEDIAKWTRFPASVNGAQWVFENGKATFTGTQNWAIQNLYQTIEVEAGHDYVFDMHVSGQGSNETYFEWYAGFNPPVAGSDYNEGGQILALNTWAGCATAPFNGMLSDVGCGTTLNGVKRFTQSGTVYILVRTASGQSSNSPFSITIDDVSVRAIN